MGGMISIVFQTFAAEKALKEKKRGISSLKSARPPRKQGRKKFYPYGVLIPIALISFSCFLPLKGSAADWKIYAGTDEGQFYYDAENITHLSVGMVHFRHKTVFSENGIARAVEALGTDYQHLEYSISVREIDCSEKKVRSLGVTYFSKDGKTLDAAIDPKSEWHPIEPTAMIEGLFQNLCKP
jgi:hypothetical protein